MEYWFVFWSVVAICVTASLMYDRKLEHDLKMKQLEIVFKTEQKEKL